MDDLAELADVRLEHAVRRWIRDHCRGQCIAGGGGLALEIGEVDVALLVAAHDDHLQPAITALAALVPWALDGIRHTSSAVSPRLR